MKQSQKKQWIAYAFFLFAAIGNAQLLAPFNIRYQTYTKGDIMVISNNITNRTDNNNGSNIPYDDLANEADMNDEFEIQYIDIDNDSSTFSSSSATLNFENSKSKKILYAGLYWSATYKYNYGKVTKSGKYIPVDKERNPFTAIKFKLPNQSNYIDIEGQTIYDGINEKQVEDFAPYIVYADVTDKLKSLDDPNGEYTVANIKSTQGKISGGVAAGWTLFIVYEDASLSGKFITSFDGFAGVTEKSTNIVFNGFQTLPSGDINAKIACSAIEGDNTLTGDQLLFSTPESKNPIQLKNTLRKVNNFFNSSITVEDQYQQNRNPNSKNTLGFDTCVLSIPNLNNTVIGNNSTEATLKLKSSGDRYYMFFTAYSVEVVEPKGNLLATANKKVIEKQKPIAIATLPEKAKVVKELEVKKEEPIIVAEPVAKAKTEVTEKTDIVKTIEKEQPIAIATQPEKAKVVKELEVKKEEIIIATEPVAKAKPEIIEKTEVTKAIEKEQPVVAQTATRKEIKTAIKNEVKPEIKSDIKAEVKQVMQEQKQDIKNEILNGLRDEIVNELKGEIIAEVKAEVKKEVKEEVKREIKQELKAVVKKQLKDELRKELIPSNETAVITNIEEKNIVEENNKSVGDSILNNTATSDILYERINTMSMGYYIIANVFAVKENAVQFVKTLTRKGFKPKSFVNLQNNYTYVYLAKADTEEEARSLVNNKLNDNYTADMWILGVNKK
jgi:hypothetical protein